MNLEKFHNIVWARFIRMPYGHLLDCAELDGSACIPTAEECEKGLPSPMGWMSPIADCAFFGGLYLFALCEKYEIAPDEKLKKEIKILADGLILLCDISPVDGFIARGVAQDGSTHYHSSSTDQVGPWALALWRIIHSTACDADLAEAIKKRLIRTISGLIAANWDIPTEWDGVIKGSFAHKDWRGVAKLMFLSAVGRELGIVSEEKFEFLATEKAYGGIYTRAEIISHGFAPNMVRNTGLIQFWIDICAQLAVRELVSLDAKRADYYTRGLMANGAAVVPFLREFEKYKPDELPPYDHDWRKIVGELKPWTTIEEGFAEGERVNRLWVKQNPARALERTTLSQAVFAAWIAIVSGDSSAADHAYACLCDCTDAVDWDKVGQCYAFVVESAAIAYEKLKANK